MERHQEVCLTAPVSSHRISAYALSGGFKILHPIPTRLDLQLLALYEDLRTHYDIKLRKGAPTFGHRMKGTTPRVASAENSPSTTPDIDACARTTALTAILDAPPMRN